MGRVPAWPPPLGFPLGSPVRVMHHRRRPRSAARYSLPLIVRECPADAPWLAVGDRLQLINAGASWLHGWRLWVTPGSPGRIVHSGTLSATRIAHWIETGALVPADP